MARTISVETSSIVCYNGVYLTYYPMGSSKTHTIAGTIKNIEGNTITLETDYPLCEIGDYMKFVNNETNEIHYGIITTLRNTNDVGLSFCPDIRISYDKEKKQWYVVDGNTFYFSLGKYTMLPCNATEKSTINNEILLVGGLIYRKELNKLYQLPVRSEEYWFITDSGDVEMTIDRQYTEDDRRYEIGNYFPCERVARDYRDRIVHLLLNNEDED